jgi:hypothetical protein
VEVIDSHGPALEYDLLTMTHYQLRDVGGALPWGALRHFLQYLPRDSALSRELVPVTESERWASGDATASVLADLYDLLSVFRSEAAVKGTTHHARRPRPYPRPWLKPRVRHVGSKPIPVTEFERWWGNG